MGTMPTNVVIGAGSGMGAAIARALVDEGALLLVDRDLDALHTIATELREAGTVEVHACDITVEDDVQALAVAAGNVQRLAVTAGLSPTMAAGRAIFEVNLIAMERVMVAFETRMGAGSAAVCFASIAGHGGSHAAAVEEALADPLAPDFLGRLAAAGVDVDDPVVAYCLSKYGVIRLVRRLAPAWGARGARILSLSPGIVDTPMGNQEMQQQPAMPAMVKLAPLGRTARAEEVAAVACFLLSPAASYMTGSDVLVDGGLVALNP